MFHSRCPGSGFDVRVEDATNRGRVDMAALAADDAHLFEFDVPGSAAAGDAMRRLRERERPEERRERERSIRLVGVEFDPEKRNAATFETARA